MTFSILLDTNVVSELMKRTPDPQVMVWFEHYKEARFSVSAITRAEIHLGIDLLPAGMRKEGLALAAARMFIEDFSECFAFDAASADLYAGLVGRRMRLGRPISTEDGQIAAIALANKIPLATRNTKDFSSIDGLTLLNPWE